MRWGGGMQSVIGLGNATRLHALVGMARFPMLFPLEDGVSFRQALAIQILQPYKRTVVFSLFISPLSVIILR